MEIILISMDQKILSMNCSIGELWSLCEKKKIGSASMLIVCLSHNDRFIGSFIHTFYECVSNVMWHFTFFFLSLASIKSVILRCLRFVLTTLVIQTVQFQSVHLLVRLVCVGWKKKHFKLWPIQFSEISVIYRKFPITVKILLWNTEKTQRLNKIL